jgi:putative Mg2+ transporter-C (MgtC) family protein
MSYDAQVEFALWVLLAVGLGGLVGLERELRGHEAGLRTSALVCGGAAMFGRVSQLLGEDRVAAGVVQGIGAGLIIHGSSGGVRGATTAATVWVLAALGLIVSEELWVTALILSVSYVVLLELAPISDWLFRRGKKLPGPSADESGGTEMGATDENR